MFNFKCHSMVSKNMNGLPKQDRDDSLPFFNASISPLALPRSFLTCCCCFKTGEHLTFKISPHPYSLLSINTLLTQWL